jgi:hypothetical protein
MTNKRGGILWLPLLATILVSCGTSGDATPALGPGDTALSFTLVSRDGPAARPPQVFAATALAELKNEVAAANPPACDGDSAKWCWETVNPPSRSLLIAIYIPKGCTPGQLTGAVLKSKGVLMIQVNLHQVDCKPGAGAQPAPSFSLVSVPLDRLPIGVLTVQAHYVGGTTVGGPPSLDAQTTVEIG